MPKMTNSAKRRLSKLRKKVSKTTVKGKVKRAARLSKRAGKIIKTGKRGTGRAVAKVKKVAYRIKGS